MYLNKDFKIKNLAKLFNENNSIFKIGGSHSKHKLAKRAQQNHQYTTQRQTQQTQQELKKIQEVRKLLDDERLIEQRRNRQEQEQILLEIRERERERELELERERILYIEQRNRQKPEQEPTYIPSSNITLFKNKEFPLFNFRIKNIGKSSYINAVLQLLWMIRTVFQYSENSELNPIIELFNSIPNAFEKHHSHLIVGEFVNETYYESILSFLKKNYKTVLNFLLSILSKLPKNKISMVEYSLHNENTSINNHDYLIIYSGNEEPISMQSSILIGYVLCGFIFKINNTEYSFVNLDSSICFTDEQLINLDQNGINESKQTAFIYLYKRK